jgi:sortase (surface protein transpeptidase)
LPNIKSVEAEQISQPTLNYGSPVQYNDSLANELKDSSQLYIPNESSNNFSEPVFNNSIEQHERINKKEKGKHFKLQITLVSLAVLLFTVGMYTVVIGLRSDHVAQVQADKLTKQANQVQTSTHGNSNSSAALATVKPSGSSLANYVVAPNLPRYLKIPSLSVDARVLSVGVNASGALETPDNVFDTAWYNKSAQPGQPGAMLIDGHISSWTAHGVFYGLKSLKPGDTMQVVRGDGAVFNYVVVKSVIYPANTVNMQAAVTPVVAGVPGLNLISCSGDVIPGTSLFNERIIVFTEQIGS